MRKLAALTLALCLALPAAPAVKKSQSSSRKHSAGKKSSVKRSTAKQSTAIQSPARNTAGKKTAGKKTAAKKTAAKKTAGKKTPGKKTGATKTSGKQTASRSGTRKTTRSSKRRRTTTAVQRPSWRGGQMAPTPERYKQIQQALIDKGYLSGSPTGTWGTESSEALRRFQQDQNLEPTGKLDSLSLISLGLGPRREASSSAVPAPVPRSSTPNPRGQQ